MTYTDEEQNTLRALVEMIIPASSEYAVPGAGDEIILKDILGTAAVHHAAISGGLAALEALAQEAGGSCFVDLPDNDRSATTEAFRAAQPEIAGLLPR